VRGAVRRCFVDIASLSQRTADAACKLLLIGQTRDRHEARH
jgi:hypothetical protein